MNGEYRLTKRIIKKPFPKTNNVEKHSKTPFAMIDFENASERILETASFSFFSRENATR